MRRQAPAQKGQDAPESYWRVAMRQNLLALAVAYFMGLTASMQAHADGELSGVSMCVYVEPTNAPFSFLEEDLTKPLGLDVDIIYELQKRLGFSIQDERIYPLLRADQMERMRTGQADIIAGAMSRTDSRMLFMDFSPVYYDTGVVVLHSKTHTPDIKGLDDLAGKTVLVTRGASFIDFVKRQQPEAKIVEIANLTLGYFDVAQGKADALLYDYPIVDYFSRTMPGLNLEPVGELFDRKDSQYVIGFRKDSPYTRYFLQEMREMRQDGTLDRLKEKWHLQSSTSLY